MSLLSSTLPDIDDSTNNKVSYNTGTQFDLATGYFEEGVDGKMYMTGGLGCQFNSFVGQNGNFKSTTAAGLTLRSAAIYNDSVVVINDNENSIDKDKDRVLNMTEELRTRLDPNSVVWMSGVNYSLEDLDAWILEHCNKKQSMAKDLMIETPFRDLKNGGCIKQIMPTYLFVDSLTEAYCDKEEEMLNDASSGKSGMGDSTANTAYMKDGNKKTLWTRTMRRRCEQYGIVLVVTGHYDQKMAMDMYHPNPKDTLFGKQDWAVKGCGSKFKFLSSIYARTQASVLQDSNKAALYSDGATLDKDIFEVDILLDRCKAMNAGTVTPFVCSQELGFMNAVTNYHYLKLSDFWGCDGSKQRQQLKMMPDVTISRNTIRTIANSNEQFRRALELTAQLCFIKNNWNPARINYDLSADPRKIFDWLLSDKHKDLKQNLLNSRGYWSYKKEDKPYMSVFDIIDNFNKEQ